MNDYENFEKGMIYMKILKKGAGSREKGEEETKSMPHAPVILISSLKQQSANRNITPTSTIDRVFETRSEQTKDYKIGICCFSAKHAPFRRESQDWLVRNQNNVSEWSHMSTLGLFFQ
jgi:hypothetical protein